jgi:hypothetical protein
LNHLHLAGLGRDQLGRGALALDGLPRLGELDLLGALGGHEERDSLALQLVCHVVPFFVGLALGVPNAAGG